MWRVIGEKGLHVSYGRHLVIGFVLETAREGVVVKRSKGHSWVI